MAEIVHDLLAAATTLAGLLLVFLGGLVSRFEALDPAQKQANGRVYRRRGTLAFLGFLAASFSAGLCILSHATGSDLAAEIAAVLLVCAFLAVIGAAIMIQMQFYDRS